MAVIAEYFKLQEEYERKFGKRTVVVIMIGSFYEIYEYDPAFDLNATKDDVRIGHAVEIADQLDFDLTMQNKQKEYTKRNPNKMGFPCIAYEREHRRRILDNNWTIVRIDQRKIKQPGKKKELVERFEAEVASPATEAIICNDKLPLTNYIVSIYIKILSTARRHENFIITGGVAAIDVTTGHNIVAEFYSRDQDQVFALQEIYRFLLTIRPQEVFINIAGVISELQEPYTTFISETLELERYPMIIFRHDEVPKNFNKLEYQRQFLAKVFPLMVNSQSNKDLSRLIQTDIIVHLDLESLSYGRIAYLCLLQYCYEHNERVLDKIQRPDTKWIDEKHHLVLTHNAILQLNMYVTNNATVRTETASSGKKPKSLFEIINNTSTRMGRRKLLDLMYNPMTQVSELQLNYDRIDALYVNTLWKTLEYELKGLPDIERLQRSLIFNNIKPHHFAQLFLSYIKIINIYTHLSSCDSECLKSLLPPREYLTEFNQIFAHVWNIFDLDALKTCKIADDEVTYTIYPLKGNNETYEQSVQIKNYLQQLADYLHKFTVVGGRGRDIEFCDNMKGKRGTDGGIVNTAMGFMTSKTRAKLVQRAIDNGEIDLSSCGTLEFQNMKDGTLITSEFIRTYCIQHDQLRQHLRQLLYKTYNDTISKLIDCNFYTTLANFVAKVDVLKSHAKTAIIHKYYRPVLDPEDGPSYIEACELRHPLVECLTSAEYITNDITLGKDPQGLLLYGANQVGKSTLTKSVALSVIMAQMGGFTAGKIKLRPYYKIITRLSGDDNLLKGQSSFIVAMLELRTMERNADDKTLALGDELCRETESVSGTSITIATLEMLVERGSSFLFATHMHHLVQMAPIQKLIHGTFTGNPTCKTSDSTQLRICHLHMYHDANTDLLIYDRKLKDGPGDDIYGIETAKYLGFDSVFIKRALSIRREYRKESGQLLSGKTSRYNKEIFIDSCIICGSTQKLHTHHIKEQRHADGDGFIEHTHKNMSGNLVVLCQTCHTNLHHGDQTLAVSQTVNGQLITLQ